ncbi:uncharacterized protein A4U43_UnF6560 [Asparagus officinalis]|uniref:Uncharacterized protein n=1 Tax=Asparagus officinalis TaxID=4686 RepID=A0A1R3L6F2_ASPOF|nr:uncharacterized protein A4U43_UnF6560 [Asparagus officinalis]
MLQGRVNFLELDAHQFEVVKKSRNDTLEKVKEVKIAGGGLVLGGEEEEEATSGGSGEDLANDSSEVS